MKRLAFLLLLAGCSGGEYTSRCAGPMGCAYLVGLHDAPSDSPDGEAPDADAATRDVASDAPADAGAEADACASYVPPTDPWECRTGVFCNGAQVCVTWINHPNSAECVDVPPCSCKSTYTCACLRANDPQPFGADAGWTSCSIAGGAFAYYQ